MNKERIITWTLFATALVYFQFQIHQLSSHSHEQTDSMETTASERHFELAAPMGQMQKYMDKLYFAGAEKNWDLAHFYLHEIEEQAESIAHANVMEDGVNVSNLTESILIPQIETLEAKVKSHDAITFQNEYKILVSRCNSCHTSTDHGFIHITIPQLSMFKNQNFSTSVEAETK